jgi:hypothetical protein
MIAVCLIKEFVLMEEEISLKWWNKLAFRPYAQQVDPIHPLTYLHYSFRYYCPIYAYISPVLPLSSSDIIISVSHFAEHATCPNQFVLISLTIILQTMEIHTVSCSTSFCYIRLCVKFSRLLFVHKRTYVLGLSAIVSWDSSIGTVTRYGLYGTGIEYRWGRDFPRLSRTTLGLTQLTIQWISGLSRGKSGRGVALTTHPI